MEKKSDNLLNFSNLPSEIQQHIVSYLDARALGFFARSDKHRLKSCLASLINYQSLFALQLIAKQNSTYLYNKANQLFVCGSNEYGQLGLGDEENRSTITTLPWPENQGGIEQVIAGGSHAIVLTQDNKLCVCGHNGFGELGLGDTKNRSTFTVVPWPEDRGKIQQVIAGQHHTIVLTENNKLWVCGDNTSGQLGLGNQMNHATFIAVPWPEDRGKIQQVITAGMHTLVLTEDKRLWVCGGNMFGQLGFGDETQRFTFTAVPWQEENGRIQQVVAGLYHTVMLTEDNQLWVCGGNMFGQLGLGNRAQHSTFTLVPWPAERGKIKQIITGGYYTIVLTHNNRLWGCGLNASGQLGLEGNNECTTFTEVEWPAERGKIQQGIAGLSHTILLTEDNCLWVCGDNVYGQLGLEDQMKRSTFELVKMLQVFNFSQLIKISTALTLTSATKLNTIYSQRQSDEPEGQPPLKKMRL